MQTVPLNPNEAGENLIRTLANVEFVLGVENLRANRSVEAVQQFKLAAEHGHPGATFNLGVCYETGIGVEKNEQKAFKYYFKAAHLGHNKAMYNLGVFYAKGLGGLQKDRIAAQEWISAADSVEVRKFTQMKKGPSTKKKAHSISDEGYKSDPGQISQHEENKCALQGLETKFMGLAVKI